jgi:hypothetical protein
LDSERLQWIALVALGVLVVLAVVVVRFVQKVAVKVVLLAVMAGAALLAWNARNELGNCAETCACKVYGLEIHVPEPACDEFGS